MVKSKLTLDIEWKCVYVGSAEDDSFDQNLESVLIGPLQIGSMKFELETAAPDHSKIPSKDLIGVTAILLTCSYNNQEFFRVGYYVNVTFDNEEMNLNPPENIDINHVVKNILHDKPRITKFNIEWDCAVTAIPSFTNFTNDNQSESENNKNFINENSNHMINLNHRMGGNSYFDNNHQNTNFMFSNNNTINNQGTMNMANHNFSN